MLHLADAASGKSTIGNVGRGVVSNLRRNFAKNLVRTTERECPIGRLKDFCPGRSTYYVSCNREINFPCAQQAPRLSSASTPCSLRVSGKGIIVGFDAKGMVKRSDFWLGKYVPIVSDETTITISAAFKKRAIDHS
jgi:hypothetical protein